MPSVITSFRRHLPVFTIRLFHASHRFISTATGRNPAVASRDTIPSPSGCSRIEGCGGETVSDLALPCFAVPWQAISKTNPTVHFHPFIAPCQAFCIFRDRRTFTAPIRACLPGKGFIIRKIEGVGGGKSFVGFGIAVRIKNPAAVDFSEENGRWF